MVEEEKAKKMKRSKQIDFRIQNAENWTLNLLQLFRSVQSIKTVDQFGGWGKWNAKRCSAREIMFSKIYLGYESV